MELQLIEQLASVMARTAIEELEYSHAGARVRLMRAPPATREVLAPTPTAARVAMAPATTAAQPPSAPAAAAQAALHLVVAGMSGTFYGAAAPGEAPFVKVGDLVQEGQVLAVVEAMKMLNQIEADASGRITRVAQTDGTAVSPNTVLFEIEPQGS